MNDIERLQVDRFLDSVRLITRAMTDLAFEARRANEIEERRNAHIPIIPPYVPMKERD